LGQWQGVLATLWLREYQAMRLLLSMLFAQEAPLLLSIFKISHRKLKLEKHWFPHMGGRLRFLFGMLGFYGGTLMDSSNPSYSPAFF